MPRSRAILLAAPDPGGAYTSRTASAGRARMGPRGEPGWCAGVRGGTPRDSHLGCRFAGGGSCHDPGSGPAPVDAQGAIGPKWQEGAARPSCRVVWMAPLANPVGVRRATVPGLGGQGPPVGCPDGPGGGCAGHPRSGSQPNGGSLPESTMRAPTSSLAGPQPPPARFSLSPQPVRPVHQPLGVLRGSGRLGTPVSR